MSNQTNFRVSADVSLNHQSMSLEVKRPNNEAYKISQQDKNTDACYSTVINGTVLLIVFLFCITGCIVYVSLL